MQWRTISRFLDNHSVNNHGSRTGCGPELYFRSLKKKIPLQYTMDDSLQEIHVTANNMRMDEDILEYFQTHRYVDPNQFIRECIDHYKEFHTIPRPSAPVPTEENPTITISQQELASWYRDWQQFQTQRAQVLLLLQGMNLPNNPPDMAQTPPQPTDTGLAAPQASSALSQVPINQGTAMPKV